MSPIPNVVKRSLTGIRASGDVHLGNYLGMIRPALEYQNKFQCLYFIADLHALTTNKNPALLRQNTLDIAATWLALGLDHKKHLIYKQSDVPMVTEFSWYLSVCTGMGLLEKGHSYKDASATDREVNHGVFAYPVLMAADIMMYDADQVPVGKDQKQHVEMARDMAGSFNALYGNGQDIIKLPVPVIKEEVMLIPGLDGRKMSKSYDNYIPLFCDEKILRKKIMSIRTDSTDVAASKTLKDTLIGQIYALFGSPTQYADLEKRLNQGGLGWGHAKEELFDVINSEVSEPRRRFNEFKQDIRYLAQVLDEGAGKAHEIALPVLNRVRQAVGVGARHCSGSSKCN